MINSGVSGSTTQDLLAEFHWRAGRFAGHAFVMFGTNDMNDDEEGAGFRFRLDQIVQRGGTWVPRWSSRPRLRCAEGVRTPT